MIEVEKLYELAGVEKECKIHTIDWQSFKEYYYPPFTAEKQIELILFYVNRGIPLEFEKTGDKNIPKEVLTNTIAGLACRLWHDLTEEEKNEIREILR